ISRWRIWASSSFLRHCDEAQILLNSQPQICASGADGGQTAQPPKQRSRLVDSEAVVQFAENFLGQHPWFGGAAFSCADIMMMFPLNAATGLNLVDEVQFPNVAAWKVRIEARPAYKRMLAKARPDGMIGSLPRLPQHAPSGPREAAKPPGSGAR
uniref:glutathione binding-like protein n=1 Tax=Caulobacter sp. 3R27C2-B TaxID=2502219 RepID=UPI001BB0DB01